ncbi:hypothetical protein K504DRAFT_108457 [Pleomassaria siparia CBS 279.74]|uniref:Transmembrane protein n=1 Tax=Pleomassaria siparia CBS 279.74 TaxID=1314801 RepID=A0A6G1JX09_9PLEO|nr:hypothetical protein K504DRAFT_108457 [Pleomassaria siparia CBS 279.74]
MQEFGAIDWGALDLESEFTSSPSVEYTPPPVATTMVRARMPNIDLGDTTDLIVGYTSATSSTRATTVDIEMVSFSLYTPSSTTVPTFTIATRTTMTRPIDVVTSISSLPLPLSTEGVAPPNPNPNLEPINPAPTQENETEVHGSKNGGPRSIPTVASSASLVCAVLVFFALYWFCFRRSEEKHAQRAQVRNGYRREGERIEDWERRWESEMEMEMRYLARDNGVSVPEPVRGGGRWERGWRGLRR